MADIRKRSSTALSKSGSEKAEDEHESDHAPAAAEHHGHHSRHHKEKASEEALGTKTRHNHPFAVKLVPSVLSSDNTEHNFRGLVHVGTYC
jgi:hypothetical protein